MSSRTRPEERPRPPAIQSGRALELLAEGRVEVLGRIPWASNATLLAEVEHRGLRSWAVYKPGRGERPLWDFPNGTLYRREVAAYLVSEALGWGLVPPTLARARAPFGPGSLQLWVDADPAITAFELLEAEHPALPRVAVFDVVVNNADRKAGHCLVVGGADGDPARVWAIDHGVCFHAEPKLRTVIWQYAGEPIGEEATDALLRLRSALAGGDLAGRLERLLAPREVGALDRRVRRLLDRGVLPHPGSERAYPWPPV